MEQSTHDLVHIHDLIDGLQKSQLMPGAHPLDQEHREELLAIIEELHVAEAELVQQSEGIAILKRALEIERQHCQNLMEYSSDAYLVTDAKGQILASNHAAERMLRRSKSQMTGKYITEFILSDEVSNLHERMLSVTETDAFINWETRCQPSMGSNLNVSVSVYGVRDFVTKTYMLHWQIQEITLRIQPSIDEHEQYLLLYALYDTITALSETVSPEDVLDQALNTIRQIAPFDFVSILLLEQRRLCMVRSFGYAEEHSPFLETVIASLCVPDQPMSLEEYLINVKKSLLITDEAELSRWPPLLTSKPVRSMLAIPLVSRSGILGALLLCCSAPDFFTNARVGRLQLLAVQTTILLQYAQWYQMATYLAILGERERVAHELHDTVNQRLFSMSIIADILPDLWETKPTKALAMLDQLRELTQGALEEMRTFLRELRETSKD